MSDAPRSAAILGRWVHSHEEDEGDRKVFRPSTYAFPPSRGRSWFELKPGGSLLEGGPGPTDRSTSAPGRWTLDGDSLCFLDSTGPGSTRTLTVASVGKDKLVVTM